MKKTTRTKMATTKTKTKTTSSRVVEAVRAKPTVHGLHERIAALLDVGAETLDRTSYLELLVRVADTTNDRSDAINDAIAKEHHEDRDV